MKQICTLGLVLIVWSQALIMLAGEALPEEKIFLHELKPITLPKQPDVIELRIQKAWDDHGNANFRSFVSQIEVLLQDVPKSEWAPSLHANLGFYYRQNGRYSDALNHFERGWEAVSDFKEGTGKETGDFILAHWMALLCRLGRTDALTNIISTTAGRVLDRGPLTQMYLTACEATGMMLRKPEISFQCGAYAVENVMARLGGERQWLALENGSPVGGYSLKQLEEFSSVSNKRLVAVKIPRKDQLIVPSVIHWKSDHYAAIVEQHGTKYRVVDPTFGSEQWLEKEDFLEEASGYFLVSPQNISDKVVRITEDEARAIHGKGGPNHINDDSDQGEGGRDDCVKPNDAKSPEIVQLCDPNSHRDIRTDCWRRYSKMLSEGWRPAVPSSLLGASIQPRRQDVNDNKGMPDWSISEPYISLWLRDTPLSYFASRGPEISVSVAYKQRDSESGPSGLNTFTLGYHWNSSFKGYVQDISTPIVHLPGGGILVFQTNGIPEYNTGARLFKTSSGYDLIFSDGSTNKFDYGVSVAGGGTTNVYYFMTKVLDPTGTGAEIVYKSRTGSDPVRVDYIKDPDNLQTTFEYETTINKTHFIKKITDPYGRYTQFTYNTNDLLYSIRDVGALTTSFLYDGNGWITNMNTPYGETSFYLYGTTTAFSTDKYRVALITPPVGNKHLYIYSDGQEQTWFPTGNLDDTSETPSQGSPLGPNRMDTGFSTFRNSFYWSPNQMPKLTVTNNLESSWSQLFSSKKNFEISRWRHWLHALGGYVSGTLSFQRDPLPYQTQDGSGMGKITWFDYYGKPTSGSILYISYQGTNKQPATVFKKMPDGSRWHQIFEYDELLRVREREEIYFDGSTNTIRTTGFNYDGFDLVTVTNYLGELSFRNGFNDYHQITETTNLNNQVTKFFYNSLHQLNGVSLSSGLAITNTFNSTNFLSKTENYAYVNGNLQNYRSESYTYTNGVIRTVTDERNLQTTYTFDDFQRLKEALFPDSTLSLTYNKLDLVAVKDRRDKTNYYFYDANRRLTHMTNEMGAVFQNEYCDCGALENSTAAVGDPLESTASYKYDLLGRMTEETSPDGEKVSYEYDSVNRVVKTQNGFGEILIGYNIQGLPTVVSNSFGKVWEGSYDIFDRLTNQITFGVQVTNLYDSLHRLVHTRNVATGGRVEFAYNDAGLWKITNELSKVTVIDRDPRGLPVKVTDANLGEVLFNYDSSGLLKIMTNQNSALTKWNYDQEGRLTNKVDALNNEILRFAYHPGILVSNQWSPEKGNILFSYDDLGNPASVKLVNDTNTFSFNKLGRLETASNSRFTIDLDYTPGGKIKQESGPWELAQLDYSYYTNAPVRKTVSISRPNDSPLLQTYSYDAAARMTNIDFGGQSFGYLYKGVIPTITNILFPNSAYITRNFDSALRMNIATLYRSGGTALELRNHNRNSAGQVESRYGLYDEETLYSYDNLGQLVELVAGDNTGDPRYHEHFKFQYDSAGNLLKKTNNNELVQTFTINSLNQVTNATRSGTFTIAGTTTSPATNITVNGTSANVVQYIEDNTFSKSGLTLTNGLNQFTVFAQDSLDRKDTNTVAVNLPYPATLQYDQNGNLTNDTKRQFTYDDFNQLTSVTLLNGPNATDHVEFEYDPFGRRRVRKEYTKVSEKPLGTVVTTGSSGNTYGGWIGLKLVVGSNPILVTEVGRWVLSGNSQTHTVKLVDANGTAVSGGSAALSLSGATAGQFAYQALSTPVWLSANTTYYLVSQEFYLGDYWYQGGACQLTTTGDATISNSVYSINGSTPFNNVGSTGNSYGPVNLRYTTGWKLTNETRYLYEGMLLVQERDGDNRPTVTYVHGLDMSGSLGGAGGIGGYLARVDHTTDETAYYMEDGLGNVIAMLNEQQKIVARYHYEPFGSLISKSGPLADENEIRFSSEQAEEKYGLLYYGFRYYDPLLQRWLNQDPLGEAGGLSLYQFNYNNPIRYVDPDGLSPMDVVLGVTDYIPSLGAGLRNMQGNATMNAMLAAKGYSSLQEFQLDNPGYGGTMTAGNMAAVGAAAGVAAGAGTIYITGVTSVTPTAVGTRCALWTATRSRSAAQNAFRHFGDHGADFAARNAVDYVTQAKSFLHNPPTGTLTRVRPNGDVVRYNPASNTFGVMDASGAPRTFYKPDPAVHGYPSNLDYFNAQ